MAEGVDAVRDLPEAAGRGGWPAGTLAGDGKCMAFENSHTSVIIDITVDDPRLPEVVEVLHDLRPKLTIELMRGIYAEGHPQGLRYTAVEHDGAIVAVAGWRLVACTTAGRRLYIDDLVTQQTNRSAGHGSLLLRELEDRARAAGCSILDLDSGVHRGAAHRFYFRERMTITGYHFGLPL
jgi:GNAT superfamily N-acetyltransferase